MIDSLTSSLSYSWSQLVEDLCRFACCFGEGTARRVSAGKEEEIARCAAAVKGETVRCAPAVEEDISSRSAGILRPHPDDACTAEGGLLSPRARPRARRRVFAPSPTMLGPFAPQRVAAAMMISGFYAADRCDVAKAFEASCCLPFTMAVRACTCTCDCTATVTPTAVGGRTP